MADEWGRDPNYASGEHDGRKWIILRGPFGSFCGYVEIKDDDQSYESYDDYEIECHGGLTFMGDRPYFSRGNSFSWAPSIAEIRCIGFDTSHYGDFAPKLNAPGVYRTFDFVLREVLSIVSQMNEKYGASVTQEARRG